MAKLAGKARISLGEMSQEINLRRYLGREVTDQDLELFKSVAIEYINDRTLSGKELGGTRDFRKYSEEYANRKGVSVDNVDLFLEGDMLDAVGATDDGEKKVTITLDDSEVPKGYNHHVGDTTKERPWFGLTSGEVRDIANFINDSTVVQEIAQEEPQRTGFSLSELEDALRLLGLEQES